MTPHVLIAGPSASGKSTLASALAAKLGRPLYCLDDYFIRGMRVYVEAAAAKVRTFERPAMYDGEALANHLAGSPPAIAEGFCLFSYAAISALPGLRFYVDVPFATCLGRRMRRLPRRPSDESFRAIGEEETRVFVQPQRDMEGVVVLDGRQPIESLVQEVLRRVR